MEKWIGRGGSVGNAQISQTLIGLEPGCYELTAGAQNIQEDTPTAAQTGACIFAGDEQETVSATDDYSVRFAVIDGTVTIGFKAEKASGNWIAIDNFRLKKVEGDLSQKLAEALTSAQIFSSQLSMPLKPRLLMLLLLFSNRQMPFSLFRLPRRSIDSRMPVRNNLST